jgi:hypothetical protein
MIDDQGTHLNRRHVHENERGIALVMAMLILLVMTLLGLVLMAGASINRSLAGNDQRMRQTLNIAEAGVGEAIARIRNQETLMQPNDPDDVCQIFNALPGSVPTLGADSTALATGQPAGQFLNYTKSTKGPDVLTIAWKKDPTGTLVMRYDPTKAVAMNTLTGSPVFVIHSTGRVGNTRRSVISEVIQKPYIVNVKGALTTDITIDFVGNAAICGYDHPADTPLDEGMDGRGMVDDATHCIGNELVGGGVPGAWSTGPITGGGASGATGDPAGFTQLQTNFYTGPWDALSMTQSEFWDFVGPHVGNQADWNGVFYYDNNSIPRDRSGDITLNSTNGEGFLYVDGDLKVNGDFYYRGLIFCEGDFDISGSSWILGGLIAKGETVIKANGGMTILYSLEAIQQALAKYGGQFVTLSWREE